MNKTNRLKEIRVNRNISVSQLSREAEISERYLRFIESGEKNPSLKTAKKIAKCLNLGVDDIFFFFYEL